MIDLAGQKMAKGEDEQGMIVHFLDNTVTGADESRRDSFDYLESHRHSVETDAVISSPRSAEPSPLNSTRHSKVGEMVQFPSMPMTLAQRRSSEGLARRGSLGLSSGQRRTSLGIEHRKMSLVENFTARRRSSNSMLDNLADGFQSATRRGSSGGGMDRRSSMRRGSIPVMPTVVDNEDGELAKSDHAHIAVFWWPCRRWERAFNCTIWSLSSTARLAFTSSSHESRIGRAP
jgi:hypothetical protein